MFDDVIDIFVRFGDKIIVNILQLLNSSIQVHANAIELLKVLLVEKAVVAFDELHIEVVDLILEDGNSLVLDKLILLDLLVSASHWWEEKLLVARLSILIFKSHSSETCATVAHKASSGAHFLLK